MSTPLSSALSPSPAADDRADVIAIGASQGGLDAVTALLSFLPPWFQTPVLLVQHRRAEGDSAMADVLQAATHLIVQEPGEAEEIRPGYLYLAPAGYHLLAGNGTLGLSLDPPVSFSRPSIDVLFESVAVAYREHAVAVMLTSASDDGAQGALAIKQAGGRVLVEDPKYAVSAIGPRAVMAAVQPDVVASVAEIAKEIAARAQGPR